MAGACFGISTIALIGGATDNQTDVITPVDGVSGVQPKLVKTYKGFKDLNIIAVGP
jgi:hypothetical protein